MNTIQQLLRNEAPLSFSDYQRCYRKILPLSNESEFVGLKKIRIAHLSSFTTKGIQEILTVQCIQAGISPEFYAGDYNQYNQEILNPKSGLHAFRPDVIFLFIDTQTLLGDFFFRPYEISSKSRISFYSDLLTQFQALIEKMKADFAAQIIVHDLEVPVYSPLGILENKQEVGFHESLRLFNSKLRELYKNDSKVFVFSYDSFCSMVGKNQLADPKMVYMGDFKLSIQHLPALCHEYLSYLKAYSGLSKKCLVLDLDNTLWGGILGEDGFAGIHLGPTPQGRPFWEFQQYILALFQRGVILAINSRNNPKEVLDTMRKHPYMVLKESHFAAMQINWDNKASNLTAIAKEINIGIDSLIFFDDDQMNRELVRQTLPQVQVVEVPQDPTLYPQTLKSLDVFNILQLTEEDQTRGAAYASERLRENLKKEISVEDYLKSLGMVLSVQTADAFTVPRIAQLTQKTNQFNMTTRRYTESDIKRLSENPHFHIWSFRLTDRFGDSGIIAVLIAEVIEKTLRIDSFLMSCRVLGRKVEDALLTFLQRQAIAHHCSEMLGEFIPTEKNIPAKEFYKNHNFVLRDTQAGVELWRCNVSTPESYPCEIKMECSEP